MKRRHACRIGILALAWAANATPVAADCAPSAPLAEVLPTAEIAFVGEVVGIDGPIARFSVRELWAGDVPASVEVRGLGDGTGFSEDDRHWSAGTTYLVVPFLDGGVLRDNLCTPTTEWRDALAELRPADFQGLETQPAGVALPLLLVGGAIALVAAASALAFRRRERPER
jgi:hypothetical protein